MFNCKFFSYRSSVAILTYFAYMCYHMSRKPISVVKSVLHRNCSDLKPPNENDPNNWCEWAPFGECIIATFNFKKHHI